jgi:hypothetical protein
MFAGIKNEKEAKDLWAYLKQFDSQGKLNRSAVQQANRASSEIAGLEPRRPSFATAIFSEYGLGSP